MDNTLDFATLFDLRELQTIQDAFAEGMGVASLITRPDGTPLTRPSNFSRFCRDVIRQTPQGLRNCYHSDACLGSPDPSGPTVRPCQSAGLWDAGASIVVEGRHLANWLMGQVRDEEQTAESFLPYADAIGADREAFLLALAEVPVMSRERFHKVARALHVLANQISRQAYLIHTQKRALNESHRARKELRHSEEKFRTIVDSINEFLFVHDPRTGAILDVNRRALEEYGYTKEQMLRLNVADLSLGQHPFDQAQAEQRMRQAMAGAATSFEWRAKRRDGTTFWVDATIRPARVGDDEALLVTARDVTERKAIQEELLREKAFTDAIVDSVPGLLYIYDDQGRLIRWNKKHEELTGYSGRELAAMTLDDWHSHDPEALARITRAVAGLAESGYVEEEAFLLSKNGERRLYLLTAVPLLWNDRRFLMGVGIDISERRRLQELLVQTEKMQSVGILAAGMAHEINNPLSGILQNAQVLARRLTGEVAANLRAAESVGCPFESIRAFMEMREVPAMLDAVRTSASRAAHIVTSLLEFSRIGESCHVPADINQLLDKALILCATDFDLKHYDFRHIAVVKRYADDLPLTPCVETQMQQVFLNILSNAAQAMQGAADPMLVLRTWREGDHVAVEITDNGPGMEEGLTQRIFDPFFTTKPVGEGTGLGLSITYFIVTKHHRGRINVRSRPGQGSTFRVELPLRSDPHRCS